MAPDARAEIRFRSLYEEHGSAIYAYFRRRTDEPGDCTADTFLVVWRRIDDVPEGEAALRWLYGVARRVLLNRRRSRSRFRRLRDKLFATATEVVDGPETTVIRRAEDRALLDALGRLSERDQELLRLATWEKLPHAEIGTLFGCSAHAVDQRIQRALKRLAREMHLPGHQHVVSRTPIREPRSGTG